MSLVIQLSDLHLLADEPEQADILEALVSTVGRACRERRQSPDRGQSPDLVVITGDVFDSAELDVERATAEFADLDKKLSAALGSEPKVVVVPGNHDRRRFGVLRRRDCQLFQALRHAMPERILVHGCEEPLLARRVAPEFHRQPFWLVAYDSTFLPKGLVSAGGVIRQEDILWATAAIGEREPDWPIVLLLHHHLVSTPVTDLGQIHVPAGQRLLRWLIKKVLPQLVSNADREELTMTALGAGSSLSTLHALGRAVLVLHGHKHYATARLLAGTAPDQGDVLLVSAGSAGLAERWNPDAGEDAARLWPSFNVIDYKDDAISVDQVSFGYRGDAASKWLVRRLVHVERHGRRFSLRKEPVDREQDTGPELLLNQASITLSSSERFDHQRWDLQATRRVDPVEGARIANYIETVSGLKDALLDQNGRSPAPRLADLLPLASGLPQELALPLSADADYRVYGAQCRTLSEARRVLGEDALPFGSVSLMNRYPARVARLRVRGLGERSKDSFATITDLGTGLERPLPLLREGEEHSLLVEYPDCPARTLIRVYFVLR